MVHHTPDAPPVSMRRVEIRPTVRWARTFPGSSFRVALPLQSSFALTPARPFRAELHCLGFRPPRGITGVRPRSREIPTPRSVPPSGFLNLSAVCSALRLRGLVASRSHVQGLFSFRGFFLRAATLPRRKDPAPLPLCLAGSPTCVGVHLRCPRLRGVSPRGAAFLRSPFGRSPPRVRLLQVLFFFANDPGLPRIDPLLKFPETALIVLRRPSPLRRSSSVFSAKNLAGSSPSCRPAREF